MANTATPKALQFKRGAEAGRYVAEGRAAMYLVRRDGTGWLLQVCSKRVVAGVAISDRLQLREAHPTAGLAKAVAVGLESGLEHWRAVSAAYRAETAARLAR